MRNFFKMLKNPTVIALLSLIVALVGGIPGLMSIKRDIFKTRVDVSYDKEHTFLTRIVSDQKARHGKRVIVFYALRFFGSGEVPTTIKNIELYVKIGWRWLKGTRIDLYLNKFPGQTNGSIVLGNTIESWVIVDWTNFRGFLGQYYIERGKTVPFNVAFMFDIDESQIENSRKWQIVITDFAEEKYTTTIDSPEVRSLFTTKNLALFDCYLGKPDDVQKLLKERALSYQMIQNFLTSKYGYKPPWYE